MFCFTLLYTRLCLLIQPLFGQQPKGVDDLCFHTYGEFCLPFWAATPKQRADVLFDTGGNFETSVLPSVRPSVCPSPPVDHPGLKLALPGLKLALPGLNLALQTSNQPSWLEISLPHASNLPFRPQICPPDLQSAFQASNQPSKPQICSPSLITAL